MNEILQKMKELEEYDDYEMAHHDADDLLCEALIKLGQSELVESFKKVGRWYA
jgi:hypothetical protein